MEKSWRLQRYNQKNYSELVEFPVEIIGRDGTVRRYAFEDAIRLYRRRITFAGVRYPDADLVGAEVEHCRSRIEQLRRSYFYRYGWGTPAGEPGPVDLFGSVAGELAAFLCKILRVEGRPQVQIEPAQDMLGPARSKLETASLPESVWFVHPHDSPVGMILYVHRFDGTLPETVKDEAREAFFARVKELERNGPIGGDGERMLGFHHTIDCGFILTARGEDFEALDLPTEERDEPPTPWDEAYDALRHGQTVEGLARCRRIVVEQPWHRQAYVAGAAAAMHLGQFEAAEDLALVGSKYFPDDGAMFWYLGHARVRQGRRAAGVADLQHALRLSPLLHTARLLLVVLLLQAGRVGQARHALRDAPDDKGDDRRAHAALHRLAQWLFWRQIMVGFGQTAAALGLFATALAGWFGLVPVALGVTMAGIGLYGFSGELRRVSDWARFDDLAHVVRRLKRISPDERG